MDYDKTEMPGGYDAGRGYSPQQLESWLDVIARSVTKLPSEILDLGCGTGRYSAALAERFGARVIGVEPSDKMLAEAGRKASVECQSLEKRCAAGMLRGWGETVLFTSASLAVCGDFA